MKNSGRKLFCALLALCLIGSMTVPAFAAVPDPAQPFSSPYLSNYSAYIYPPGGGVVEVWYHASGTTEIDYLGSLIIQLYESTDDSNYTWVATFTNSQYPSMLGSSTDYYSSHVTYNGVPGRYYKAYVNIYAGPAEGGTSRYFWTSPKVA